MAQWITFETRDEAEESLTGRGYQFARNVTPTLRLASGEHVDCYAPHLWQTEDGQQLLLTDSVINWIVVEPRQPV